MEEKEHKNIGEKKYENVGPTAWRVAYFRAQSDIKYAAEIFAELDSIVKPTTSAQIEYMESSKTSNLAPQFEARYKLIDLLLEKHKTKQILEIAAGLSPRGLAMAEADSDLQYVELDLPQMAGDKRKLLGNLFSAGQAQAQSNLHIEDGDALNLDSLAAATKYFGDEPISVIHEGLLRYLNFEQKAIVAKNIRSLLEKFGGAWITSDITLKKILHYEKEREDNRRRIMAISGIDVEANCFDSVESACDFFDQLGFSVEQHSFLEVIDQLVSPQRQNISIDEVKKMIRHAVVFVMRLK
ncbi:MAG: class I SAM-dependent methyltransferase [Candidatus Buchananbacteria bacterium]|nr:class I SAM-dependent methyltransferase [Candidatus Buchananbacteria bacterium]